MLRKSNFHLLKFFLILTYATIITGCSSSLPTNNTQSKISDDFFLGEIINSPIISTQHIKDIQWDVSFPESHKLLIDAKPYLKLYTAKKEIVKITLDAEKGHFQYNKSISENQIFAEFGLFYCKEGEQGLCLMQNVRYTIELRNTLPSDNLIFKYEVPAQ